MELPKEEAVKIAAELYEKSECIAHRRFGVNFLNYYDDRLKLEKWLYDSFISIGGKPKKKHPLYFVLEASDKFHQYYEMGEVIRMCLDDIEDYDVSFTLGDSMEQMYTTNNLQVFSKQKLMEYIRKYNNVHEFLNHIKAKYSIVEVQLWNNVTEEMSV